MKNQSIIKLLLLFILSYTGLSFINKSYDCKVLLEPISGSYNGSCKDGLAYGRGTAKGIDTYVGMFSEGLPHGNGTYTYQNGNAFKGQFENGMKLGSGELHFLLARKERSNKVTGNIINTLPKQSQRNFTALLKEQT